MMTSQVKDLAESGHQQDDTDPLSRISVHGNKAAFEAKYGAQLEMLAEAKQLLGIAS